MRVTLRLGGTTLEVDLERTANGFKATVDGETFDVGITGHGTKRIARIAGTNIEVDLRDGSRLLVDGTPMPWGVENVERANGFGHGKAAGPVQVRPPMAGKVESVKVRAGQAVAKGDVLFVLEAMKMQNDVRAPVAGVVSAIHAAAGEAVETGRVILDIAPRV
jgi:biotin carboxyl carrier protein